MVTESFLKRWGHHTLMASLILVILIVQLYLAGSFQEAVARRCSVKKVFLDISQNSQESTCARVSFLIKLQPSTLLKMRLWHRCFPVNFVKFLSTFSYRTPPVAASAFQQNCPHGKTYQKVFNYKIQTWNQNFLLYIDVLFVSFIYRCN